MSAVTRWIAGVLCGLLMHVQAGWAQRPVLPAGSASIEWSGLPATPQDDAAVRKILVNETACRENLLAWKGSLRHDGAVDYLIFCKGLVIASDAAHTGISLGHEPCVRSASQPCQVWWARLPSSRRGGYDILVQPPRSRLCAVFYWPRPDSPVMEVATARCEEGVRSLLMKRADCHAAGGEWGPRGSMQFALCTRQMADAGKQCTDSTQCDSHFCLAGPSAETRMAGTCAATNMNFGCTAAIRDGEIVRMCVD